MTMNATKRMGGNRRTGINGSMTLGLSLILYLWTFYLVKVGAIGCIDVNNTCPSKTQPTWECCRGSYCNSTQLKCVECAIAGSGCQETECCPDLICGSGNTCTCHNQIERCGDGVSIPCCEGTFCYSGTNTCQLCQFVGANCNVKTNGFCCSSDNATCFNDGTDERCVHCSNDTDSCGGDSDPDCCTHLTCYNSTCQYCTDLKDVCGTGDDNFPCCGTLTCFNKTCQNCTVENDNCTDAEDAVPCCGTLTCFNKTCQNCTVENDNCTDAEDAVPCCGTLTCFNETCQDCSLLSETCSSSVSCCNSTGWICDHVASSCKECLTNGSPCNISNNLCCASLNMNCSNSSDVGFICVSDGGNGAPSLFNMNFSLKQLVGFAVVMVAAGLL